MNAAFTKLSMIKYESTLVTFTEVPDEISLCFNISNCPCRCKDCFEPWLRDDIGSELTLAAAQEKIDYNPYITTVCFMGGDADHLGLIELIRELREKYPMLKFAMYSGLEIWDDALSKYLDYYKVGPFKPECGPMNKKTTNQHFYKYNEEQNT